MNAACSPDRRRQKPHRDCGGTQDDDSASEEHHRNSRNAADEAERRAGEAERQVQARYERRCELAAGNQADDERAEAKALMHVQR